MVTRLQDAKIKVTLDTADAEKKLKELQDKASIGIPEKPGPAKEEERKKDEEAQRKAQQGASNPRESRSQVRQPVGGGGGGSSGTSFGEVAGAAKAAALDPLEAVLAAIAPVPIFGPAAKAAVQLAPFGPAATTFTSTLMKNIGDGAPPMVKQAVDLMLPLIQSLDDSVKWVSNQFVKVKAANDAIKPAIDAALQLTKLQVVAGGTIRSGDFTDLAAGLFKIQWAQQKLQRKLQTRVYAEIGEEAANFVTNTFKAYMNN